MLEGSPSARARRAGGRRRVPSRVASSERPRQAVAGGLEHDRRPRSRSSDASGRTALRGPRRRARRHPEVVLSTTEWEVDDGRRGAVALVLAGGRCVLAAAGSGVVGVDGIAGPRHPGWLPWRGRGAARWAGRRRSSCSSRPNAGIDPYQLEFSTVDVAGRRDSAFPARGAVRMP